MLYKTFGQQRLYNAILDNAVQNRWPTTPVQNLWPTTPVQNLWPTSCPKPLANKLAKLSDNKLSKTCRPTSCLEPIGRQAVSNQPLIVSNGTGANQPPPNWHHRHPHQIIWHPPNSTSTGASEFTDKILSQKPNSTTSRPLDRLQAIGMSGGRYVASRIGLLIRPADLCLFTF